MNRASGRKRIYIVHIDMPALGSTKILKLATQEQ
jgi:hypothetical protein